MHHGRFGAISEGAKYSQIMVNGSSQWIEKVRSELASPPNQTDAGALSRLSASTRRDVLTALSPQSHDARHRYGKLA